MTIETILPIISGIVLVSSGYVIKILRDIFKSESMVKKVDDMEKHLENTDRLHNVIKERVSILETKEMAAKDSVTQLLERFNAFDAKSDKQFLQLINLINKTK